KFKKILPLRGEEWFWCFVLGFKKAGGFKPVFLDFGEAEIGSFLILILFRNNIIFQNKVKALCF
ncbi:hypothetical protein QL320_21695, partial [Bacillus subtilis]|uniref:hypothetical protein n=1 Tax=Bacillus subtilis TaxID=1423 RepID=UPI0024AD69DB